VRARAGAAWQATLWPIIAYPLSELRAYSAFA
jgi:hypothetical protein